MVGTIIGFVMLLPGCELVVLDLGCARLIILSGKGSFVGIPAVGGIKALNKTGNMTTTKPMIRAKGSKHAQLAMTEKLVL